MRSYRFRLDGDGVRRARILLDSIPHDGSMQVEITEYQQPSSYEQQKRMFGYVVGEISAQAWQK